MFTKLTEDFLNCRGGALPGQMVESGGQRVTVRAAPASRPAPSQTSPDPRWVLSPQSRLPSAIGHHLPSRDASQVPAPQPGQAWAEVSPSRHPSLPWPSSTCPGPSLTPTSGPPWAALHPRSCHPRQCRKSTLSYSAAHALQDSSRQPSQLARPFVTWPRSQLLPRPCESSGGVVLLHGEPHLSLPALS